MKKDLDRVKRLSSVLKKMHDLENVRLISAQQTLATHREREHALIEAFVGAPSIGHSFTKAFGRRLSDAAQKTQVASDLAENLKAASVSAKAKHTTFHRRAEQKQVEWDASQERSELNKVIEIFASSSVSQANPSSLSAVTIKEKSIREVSEQYTLDEEKVEK